MTRIHAFRLVSLLLCCSFAGFAAPAMAAPPSALDLNLNNDAALVRYLAYDGRAGAFGKREMDVGLLFTTDHDYMAMFGAQVIAEAGATVPELEAGLGLKLFGLRFDRDNMFALSIGGQVKYSLPPSRRFVLGAEGYYAPNVVTTSPAESLSYVSAYAGYEVVPEALIYVGYRRISVDLKNIGNSLMDNGGHFGVRFRF